VLRNQLKGVIQVVGLENDEPGQLTLGLRAGTIRDENASVLEPQSRGVAGALQPFSAGVHCFIEKPAYNAREIHEITWFERRDVR
jgi:hypothetical protein